MDLSSPRNGFGGAFPYPTDRSTAIAAAPSVGLTQIRGLRPLFRLKGKAVAGGCPTAAFREVCHVSESVDSYT